MYRIGVVGKMVHVYVAAHECKQVDVQRLGQDRHLYTKIVKYQLARPDLKV